jgi:hypothetical protein
MSNLDLRKAKVEDFKVKSVEIVNVNNYYIVVTSKYGDFDWDFYSEEPPASIASLFKEMKINKYSIKSLGYEVDEAASSLKNVKFSKYLSYNTGYKTKEAAKKAYLRAERDSAENKIKASKRVLKSLGNDKKWSKEINRHKGLIAKLEKDIAYIKEALKRK